MAFWKRSPDPKAELKKMIGEYELPSFSTAAISTLRLLREEGDMAAVAERLMIDPGLTVRVLRTVNSAAFGMRKEVTDLTHAANLLGRSRLESIVLTAAVGGSLPSANGLDLAAFWRTSAQRACLARKIAQSVEPATAIQAFTAGLLQDMAVPVMAASHPVRYPELLLDAGHEGDRALHEMEVDVFGYDHAAVGATMAETWDLPESLITAIADHHFPGQRAPTAVEAVALIRLSDPPDELEGLRAHCQDQFAMGEPAIDSMIEAANSESASLAASMVGRA